MDDVVMAVYRVYGVLFSDEHVSRRGFRFWSLRRGSAAVKAKRNENAPIPVKVLRWVVAVVEIERNVLVAVETDGS